MQFNSIQFQYISRKHIYKFIRIYKIQSNNDDVDFLQIIIDTLSYTVVMVKWALVGKTMLMNTIYSSVYAHCIIILFWELIDSSLLL